MPATWPKACADRSCRNTRNRRVGAFRLRRRSRHHPECSCKASRSESRPAAPATRTDCPRRKGIALDPADHAQHSPASQARPLPFPGCGGHREEPIAVNRQSRAVTIVDNQHATVLDHGRLLGSHDERIVRESSIGRENPISVSDRPSPIPPVGFQPVDRARRSGPFVDSHWIIGAWGKRFHPKPVRGMGLLPALDMRQEAFPPPSLSATCLVPRITTPGVATCPLRLSRWAMRYCSIEGSRPRPIQPSRPAGRRSD